jgi:putative oxidoreductase
MVLSLDIPLMARFHCGFRFQNDLARVRASHFVGSALRTVILAVAMLGPQCGPYTNRAKSLRKVRLTMSSKICPVSAYRGLACYASNLQSLVLLLFRVSFGFQTAQSGHNHLKNFDTMVKNFTDWGIPHPVANVYISGYTEMILGTLILLGLGTRLISLPLLGNFIVAIVAVSRGDIATGFKAHDYAAAYNTILNDTAFPFVMFTLLMLAFGPGKVSIDYLLGRFAFKPKQPPVPR